MHKSELTQNEFNEVYTVLLLDVTNSNLANNAIKTPFSPNRPYQTIAFFRYCKFSYTLSLFFNTTRSLVSKTKTIILKATSTPSRYVTLYEKLIMNMRQSVGMDIRGQEKTEESGRCSNRSLDMPKMKNAFRVRTKG